MPMEKDNPLAGAQYMRDLFKDEGTPQTPGGGSLSLHLGIHMLKSRTLEKEGDKLLRLLRYHGVPVAFKNMKKLKTHVDSVGAKCGLPRFHSRELRREGDEENFGKNCKITLMYRDVVEMVEKLMGQRRERSDVVYKASRREGGVV